MAASAEPDCGVPPSRMVSICARLGSPIRRPIAARSASASMTASLRQGRSNDRLTILGIRSGIMTLRAPAAWIRVALAMFAVGWGANQFSPMLIVYRHALGLGSAEIAGLFAIYAATLIPGLLAGGPLSDRFGRRACVLPCGAVAGRHAAAHPRSARPRADRGRAGARRRCLRHGVRPGDRLGAGPVRRERAQRAPRGARAERRVRARPHRGGGARTVGASSAGRALPAASGAGCCGARRGLDRAGCPAGADDDIGGGRYQLRCGPARSGSTVAPAAPFVFGSVSMAIVVLPEEVTSASTLSAAFAGLMTALAFAAGIGVQPAAQGSRGAQRPPRHPRRDRRGRSGRRGQRHRGRRPGPRARRARRGAPRSRLRALPRLRPAPGRAAQRPHRPRRRALLLLRARPTLASACRTR